MWQGPPSQDGTYGIDGAETSLEVLVIRCPTRVVRRSAKRSIGRECECLYALYFKEARS